MINAAHRELYALSLGDLSMARDLFHEQISTNDNVIGTALGRYLIRRDEHWPRDHEEASAALSLQRKHKPPRTLDNSEIRPYSWPCVIVFVRDWLDLDDVGRAQHLLPRELWLPDGRSVPLCVVAAPPAQDVRVPFAGIEFPTGKVAPGYPVVSNQQGDTRIGTLGLIATDGVTLYALASRHALPRSGQRVSTIMGGEQIEIGTVAPEQLTTRPIASLYPDLADTNTVVNVDVGLIEIDEQSDWATTPFGIGPVGPIADARTRSYSLAMIGKRVFARGVASREMGGRILGVLYRYKSVGGLDYLTDFLIGSDRPGEPLPTRPGDSGTIWYLTDGTDGTDSTPAPLALQWGGEVLKQDDGCAPYALATSLATVCARLNLDIVRNWDDPDFRYWGAVGHYSIARVAIDGLPPGDVKSLMTNNVDNITFPQDFITDKNMSGLSTRFVPLADVPDLVWKIGAHERGPRGNNPESPNHFADMDQPSSKGTLLDICRDRDHALDPKVWLSYFDELGVDPLHQGLLPFRVWQIYDQMLASAARGDAERFLCAAGVLAHYIGDACQPLHVSAWHDGDPNHTEQQTIHHRGKPDETTTVARGAGVHSAYEDDMVNRHIAEIAAGLGRRTFEPGDTIATGADAAWATIGLMRTTIATIPPRKLVATYVKVRGKGRSGAADALWSAYGTNTIKVMGDGVQVLVDLWTSAGAAATTMPTAALATKTVQDTVFPTTFLPSCTLATIAAQLGTGTSATSRRPGRRNRSAAPTSPTRAPRARAATAKPAKPAKRTPRASSTRRSATASAGPRKRAANTARPAPEPSGNGSRGRPRGAQRA